MASASISNAFYDGHLSIAFLVDIVSGFSFGFSFGLFIVFCLLYIELYLGWIHIFGFNVLNNTTNTTGRDVVGTATVGEGPKALVDHAKTLRFVFHNFK